MDNLAYLTITWTHQHGELAASSLEKRVYYMTCAPLKREYISRRLEKDTRREGVGKASSMQSRSLELSIILPAYNCDPREFILNLAFIFCWKTVRVSG